MLRKCGVFAAIAAVVLLSTATALRAEPINLEISLSGTPAGGGDPVVWEEDAPDGRTTQDGFSTEGKNQTAAWELNWDITGEFDPVLNGSFAVTNFLDTNQVFDLLVTLPAVSVDPAFYGGSVAGSVTDINGAGATLSTFGGNPIYTALVDGTEVIATLHDAPFSITAGEFLSQTVPSASFGVPIPSLAGPPVDDSMTLRLRFELSPGDSAAFTSVFVAKVPEPSSLALAGLGLGCLVLLRRRARR